MTQPRRYLLRMAAFLAAVAAVAALLAPGLLAAFMANPGLNGLIVGVFLVGIAMNFRQVLLLKPEVEWLEGWRRGQPVTSGGRLRLLAPMAGALGERQGRMSLSAVGLRSILDSIAARLDESRELARYFVGLLIFLGLLGTFWGLSRTVGSVGEVIASLSVTGGDAALAFEHLKSGLEAPLSGMGTAFSTSLFGLAGSLVLGFLDLQAGQAQNAFYTELEDWLAGQTRLGGSGPVAEGDQTVPAYIQALLEQTADSLDELQRILARGEESRISTNANIRALTDKLSTLTDHMKAEQALMIKLGEAQLDARPLLARIADQAGGGIDEATKSHIRNMDLALSRLAEDSSRGHEELIAELRSEFKLLARTIAAVAEDAET
ncbi:flagellar motor protein MotA [Magnetospirillum sp. UT-4]|uniref:flagellar motor protein MotA n=1 Tax=Magnetospirillum sp. UT-4 TaxID=2681467 RepID=UPI0013809F77|nr:flagellar motor protein MotA [Magnetospirillum sp. UT-4]CAA7620347.1 putative MotA/TolQ/ExbB proton channel family protein [Magnetospirillum sp. UT-4]